MAKKRKQDLKAFEEYLRHLVETSPYRPFTAEQIERILQSFGVPKDLSKYRDERRIEIMKEIHDQQLAQAEAHFRDPSQIRSLGELFENTLTIKNIFISQLAQAVDLTVEEIEDYVENRLPVRRLSEAQIKKLAELTGIAIDEIRRINADTLKRAEQEAQTANESTAKSQPPKSRRPYPTTDHSAVWMIREERSKK
ncbi:MAG: hypothetical protein ACRENG_16965 [bacterium]